MLPIPKQIQLALGYFLLTALLGFMLRLYILTDIPATYRYIVHTHSHIALLGWVYTAITTLIYYFFLHKHIPVKKYSRLFWFTQATILGMLLTFPFTGYAFLSIVFSTLFIIASYWFTAIFLKYTPAASKKTFSYKLIRIALLYMVLSSIGPLTLGIIMNTAGSGSPLYRNAIYFYLHFQYNGWFIVALCGFLFLLLERHSFLFSKIAFRYFFLLLNAGVVLTFFLSILWMKPQAAFYIIAGIGAVLQLFAFGILFFKLMPLWSDLQKRLSGTVTFLLGFTAFFLIVKLIAQIAGAFPKIAAIVSTNIDYVIAYIHWTFLGVVSMGLFAFLHATAFIDNSKKGYLLYLLGFLFTEVLLVYRGTVAWLGIPPIGIYPALLVLASFILLLAILFLFGEAFRKKN